MPIIVHRFSHLICTLILCFLSASCTGGGGTASSAGSGDSFGGGIGSGTGGPGSGGGSGGGGSDAPGATPGDGGSQIGSGGPAGGGGGSSGGGSGDGSSTLTINPGSSAGGTVRLGLTFSGQTSAVDGFSDVNLLVTNTTSFQIVSEINGSLLRTFSLVNPGGETVVDDSNPLTTSAVLTDFGVNSLPYPTRGADDPIGVGGTYVQNLVIAGSGATAYDGSVVAKNDPNAGGGALRVNLFLVGNEAQQGAGRAAIDSAVTLWRVIYSRIGITLNVQVINIRSDTGVVPNPSVGSSFYLLNTSSGGIQQDALNMFIGSEISQDSSTNPGNSIGALGIAPSVPGPAVSTAKSAVAISLLLHAGSGGDYSPANVQTLSETMGHEAGHYLGLFHPVECAALFCSGGTFTGGDPLSDTTTCSNEGQCISNGLAQNLMFPLPVFDGGSLIAQGTLSGQQGEVVNLQVIVD